MLNYYDRAACNASRLSFVFRSIPQMVKKYRIIRFGGGYFAVDHDARRIRISGRSDTHGPESDRDLTKRLLEVALPTYSVAVEEVDLSDQSPDEGSALRGRPWVDGQRDITHCRADQV